MTIQVPAIPRKGDVPPSAYVESVTVVLGGSGSARIAIRDTSNPPSTPAQLRINGGPWVTAATAKAGDSLQCRLFSQANRGLYSKATLQADGQPAGEFVIRRGPL